MRQTVDPFSTRLLEELRTPPPAQPAGTDAPHVCPTCRAPFVTPVDALEVDEWHFAVQVLCPNCGWEGTNIYDDAALEAFDVGLDQGTRELMVALDALALENARDDFERFAAALQAGAVLPEDF
jgi:hypothetical protein